MIHLKFKLCLVQWLQNGIIIYYKEGKGLLVRLSIGFPTENDFPLVYGRS